VHRAIPISLAILSGFLGALSRPCSAQQGSIVRVTVVDDTNAAIPGAGLRIVGQNSLTGLAGSNGIGMFSGVAPGTYQIIATSRGFRDKTLSGVVVADGKTTELRITLELVPPKASDFQVQATYLNPGMYSQPLKEIGQPLLCQQSVPEHTERYRFIWAPTFDHPVFLQVDFDEDGAATLLMAVWSGQGGYDWGKPVKNLRKLTRDESEDLFATLADIGFWTLPSKVEAPPYMTILDGTNWFIEGVKDGSCHVVARYGSPLTQVFEDQVLVKVAKLKPYYKQNP